MAVQLYEHQKDAITKLSTGSVLCGKVGSGKSMTAIAYYFMLEGGSINNKYIPMKDKPKDLVIITTARKRDTLEWESELVPFLMSTNPNVSRYKHKVTIDSWNNINKYAEVKDAFFIFDEQRVVGAGSWVKAFIKITKNNNWILLSATPGDTWNDYIPVFIANGFYKNRSEFIREHIIYKRFSKFPVIDRYINTGRLVRLRNKILVTMDYTNTTVSHHMDVYVDYDISKYKTLFKDRWNTSKDCPIVNASELCYELRKAVNSSDARQIKILDIVEEHPKVIIFYNFNYELDILKTIFNDSKFEVAEWNGHKHQPIPKSNAWVYLVQYTAGAEGWNCVATDTIIFYSQNYSYKVMIQSSGRIDRMNTPFTDLYYYHLKSRSGIDLAIATALRNKKKFNEQKFIN